MLRLGICGGVNVEADGRPLPETLLAGRQGRLVLAYLVCERHRAVRREELAELLWGEEPPQSWASSLSAVISKVRRALTEAGLDATETLASAFGSYRLQLPETAWVDWDAVCTAVEEAERAVAGGDVDAAISAARDAESIASRGFLTDECDWVDAQHARLRDLHIRAMHARAEAHLMAGDKGRALAAARDALGLDDRRESSYRLLMRALLAGGERGEALRVWERCRVMLAEELGADPARETEAVYLSVLGENSPAQAPPASASPLPTGVVTFLLTDIVESSVLWDRNPSAMAIALERHDQLVAEVVDARGGVLLKAKLEGDATVSAFPRASGGALAALDLREAMRREAWPDGAVPVLRMALHTGEAIERDGDYFGPALNRAARLRSLAAGDRILVSQAVAEVVRDHLPEGTALRSLGEHQLRGLTRAEHVFELGPVESGPTLGERGETRGVGRRQSVPTAATSLAGPGATPLEREPELEALEGLVDATTSGAGRLLVIEGPAGIGKTLLMHELHRRAELRGLRVFTARGGELERDFGFGIVRQLFEPALAGDIRKDLFGGAAHLAERVFATAPEVPGGEAPHAVLHGLYWLVVNLAQSLPVILAVDDVQWSDPPSLRFLIHLVRRLEGLPVGIALASRTGDPATQDELQRALRAEGRPPILNPQALSERATGELIANAMGGSPTPALCAACHDATGGNPFLLTELLEELRAARGDGRVLEPDRVRELGPERVASALLMRIGQVGRDAPALARAVAVLGARADLDHAADVGGVDRARARDLVAGLRDAGILEPDAPLRFIHPIVRTAIYEDIPTSVQSGLHQRASEVLAAQGAEPETVAVHILAADITHGPTALSTLRAAAQAALGRGAPETASRYLRRALREPLTDADRVHVLIELGVTDRELGLPDAEGHLREAVELATDRKSHAQAVHALGWTVGPFPEKQRELIPLYERAAEAVRTEDRELALRIEGRKLEALMFSRDQSLRFADEAARFSGLPGETPAESMLLCLCARKVLLEGGPASEVTKLANRALSHLDLTVPGPHSMWLASTILWLPTDEGLLQAFERRLGNAIAMAGERGLANVFAWTSNVRSTVRNVTGDLRGAEADARAALDSGGIAAFPFASVANLVEALAEQGKTADAETVLRDCGLAGEIPNIYPFTVLLIARGRMHTAAGDYAAAWADFDEALRRLEQGGGGGVAVLDARLEAALIRRTLGDEDGARRLSNHALALAEAWGTDRAVGGARRVAGLLRGGTDGLPLLEEAVDLLARCPARLWHARALFDLGSALRRAGRRSAARDALAESMDLAHRCGATPLVDLAHQELVVAGARPRRIAQSGADSLTPSERRAAELAADGMTNKQIAQALFVTLRTVEMHLSSAYRKLGIDSRAKLPQALA